MDMQMMIDLMNENSKLKSGQEYNLGDFIKDLENCNQDYEVIIEENIYPLYFYSWRGSYCELSLAYSDKPITVKELLEKAKEANGKTYTGYKGGDFTMDLHTPIHIAEYGSSTYYYQGKENDEYQLCKLIGVKEVGNKYLLLTRNDNND